MRVFYNTFLLYHLAFYDEENTLAMKNRNWTEAEIGF